MDNIDNVDTFDNIARIIQNSIEIMNNINNMIKNKILEMNINISEKKQNVINYNDYKSKIDMTNSVKEMLELTTPKAEIIKDLLDEYIKISNNTIGNIKNLERIINKGYMTSPRTTLGQLSADSVREQNIVPTGPESEVLDQDPKGGRKSRKSRKNKKTRKQRKY